MFDAKAYQRDYYQAHKKEILAHAKEYYARPENQDYFLKYREARRDKYTAYARRRRRLITAGLWTFRDPAKNKKRKKQTRTELLQTRWLAYFEAKKNNNDKSY